jgi:hypothetical protein
MGFSPFLFSGFSHLYTTTLAKIRQHMFYPYLCSQRMNIGRQLSWDTLNTTTFVQTIKEAFRDPQMKR